MVETQELKMKREELQMAEAGLATEAGVAGRQTAFHGLNVWKVTALPFDGNVMLPTTYQSLKGFAS